MKILLTILGLGALLGAVGCVEEGHRYHEGYRGGASVRFYGETPERHDYDYSDGYHHRHPYDRDHYWDNDYRYR